MALTDLEGFLLVAGSFLPSIGSTEAAVLAGLSTRRAVPGGFAVRRLGGVEKSSESSVLRELSPLDRCPKESN